MTYRRAALCGAWLLLLLTARAAAQERPVWQIGTFNNSADELGQATTSGGAFVVGTNQAQDWPGVQPAVAVARAGEASAARRIRFELPAAPEERYTLRLGLIMKTARLPVVQLDVNGQRGWFYQRLETYREGNDEPSILPQYANGTLTAEIPAGYLRQGTNEIALVALNDPRTAALPGGAVLDDARLTYDALALDHGTGAEFVLPRVTDAVINPTVFYRRENGRLLEVVSVIVSWRNVAPQGTVTLALPGWSRTQTLTSAHEFGEQRLEFSVPEFAAGTRANVSVHTAGRIFLFEQTISPARKWTVFLVPHEHLDVGYSDFQPKLSELHSRVIDEALALSDKHPEFRFSLDGYWQARQFLDGRTAAEQRRFYNAIREHKIFVPAQHSVILTGFPTAEALIRSFYGAHRLNRAAGGTWDYANSTDVPTYSWSYASIMAAAGLKYFSAAANADRGPVLMLSDLHRHSPFWWEGPDGARVLMWYARHYHQIGSEFGFPPVVATGYEGLPSFLRVYERADYTPDAVLLHGTQWENTSLYPQQAALVKQWQALFAYPELHYAGFGEALAQVAARAKGALPVVRGDGGPMWEDGIASDAATAALERENERRAASAEKLTTIATLVEPRFAPPRATLDALWENIALMGEHTWGWGRSVTEPHSEDSTRELAYKRQRATAAHEQVDYLLERAMTAIAGRIDTPPRALVVFNTLNWARTGWVEFDLQKTRELFDLDTQQVVPFDVLQDEPAYQRIRFMARAVPAMGYKIYAVRDKLADATQTGDGVIAGANSPPPSASVTPQTQINGNTIENSYYRLVLDAQSGAVASIYDKQLGRDLVDSSGPYRFNQYVYVTGGDAPPATQLLTYRRNLPFAKLEAHAASAGRIVSLTRTPTGVSVLLESKGVNTPRITTEIILFDAAKRIEFVNRVRKDEVYTKEAAYFAFPFAAKQPQFSFEVQNGVVNPARDMIPGAGLEWFSAQNWITVTEAGAAATLVGTDSFLWTCGDIVRGTWPTSFTPPSATVFAYVMNNYWGTNYIGAQGGDFTFRFALTSAAKLDAAAMSRFGWEQTTPLERTLVKAQDKAAPTANSLPAPHTSFLQVNNPSVFLSTWKPAEDGGGSVLRFIELGGVRAQVQVSSPLFEAITMQRCNAVEDCGAALMSSGDNFQIELGPRQIQTIKINAPARAPR
ncbi:MAG: polysaccharide lyase family protein [Pyrinomonadaceae bacterium]